VVNDKKCIVAQGPFFASFKPRFRKRSARRPRSLRWLRCCDTPGDRTRSSLVRPYHSRDMPAYRVGTLVNNPKKDVPQCVESME
jgi:hypothetical protein